jgi:hypothetical protein
MFAPAMPNAKAQAKARQINLPPLTADLRI